jgi:arginyl-tRNA--protein-N-Asp/Glu arginylyltransferase
MLKDIAFPKKIHGSLLDDYLAIGWYRIGQIIFTTDYLQHPEGWRRVFWLRFCLDKFWFRQKQEKLLYTNRHFDVQIKPLVITDELESLYQAYSRQLDFEVSPTLQSNLFNYSLIEDPGHSVFDSELIEVRDHGRLIAAGIFDKGEKSIAGILNFFDPAYKKCSPGKWLMLLKIKYALERGLKFYYPGYIVAGWPKFDYKLFPGKDAAEIYDPQIQAWLPYSAESVQHLKNILPEPEV